MVSSVSGMSNNVAFKANAMDRVTPDMMSQPGAFSQNATMPAETQAAEPKKSSFFGTLAKTILKLAVLGGVAIAARKYIPALSKEKVPGDVLKEGATVADKAKHYFAKYVDILEEGTIGKLSKYFKANPSEADTLYKVA